MGTVLQGYYPPITNSVKRSQPYLHTHDKVGASLPYWRRAYISFSYGGKNIEDFNLIATVDGDRRTGNMYGAFEDITTTYSAIDGQFYWGTHFTNNTFNFTLSTDGMTEEDYMEFQYWFQPGQVRELILSEHPNRAIMARVVQTPMYSLIPFKQDTTYKFVETHYKTITALYKGSIQLSLVADDPFWYSRYNVMPRIMDPQAENYYSIIENQALPINSMTNKDALKIMLEDGIPHEDMLLAGCFYGGNLMAFDDGSGEEWGAIAGYREVSTNNQERWQLPIRSQAGTAVLKFKFDTATLTGIDISSTNVSYLYYCGTAPAHTKLKFDLTPILNEDYYIIYPYNAIAQLENKNQYNVLSVGSVNFEFTTPGIYTGYNQAIYIIYNFLNNNSKNTSSIIEEVDAVELRKKFRQDIKEYYSRAWAMYSLNSTINSSYSVLINKMTEFLVESDGNENLAPKTASFIFDSQTGEAIGTFQVNTVQITTDNSSGEESFKIIEENVGDMVCSDYLILRDRNYLNEDHSMNASLCTPISFDSSYGIQDFLISYKYMYL